MGGPTIHLGFLVEYFEKNKGYKIRTFSYGSKVDGGSLIEKKENTFSKIVNTLRVFMHFIYQNIVFRPHIIHINTAFDSKSIIRDTPFAMFAWLLGKKLIFKLHGSSYELINTHNKLLIRLIKIFFRGARKVGVLSHIERAEFETKFGFGNKIIVVKNIVKPVEVGAVLQTDLPFSKDPERIYALFISRLIKGKGLDDIIKAMPDILRNHGEFILLVAGDGPDKQNCMRLAQDLGVHDSIRWMGYVDNSQLPNILKNSHLFLFLSHLPEGMPMALVEALQSGIPIITTPVRFAVNYLENDIHCCFVETGNKDELVTAVNRILTYKNLRMQMKKNNPKMVEKFRQEAVGGEFDQIYRSMLGNSFDMSRP